MDVPVVATRVEIVEPPEKTGDAFVLDVHAWWVQAHPRGAAPDEMFRGAFHFERGMI